MKRASRARRLRASDDALTHGLGGQPGMGAAEGTQGVRDGKGDEEVRPWELLCGAVLWSHCRAFWC